MVTCTQGHYIDYPNGDVFQGLIEGLALQRRRDTTRLIYEILRLSQTGITKYHLMQKVNISLQQADDYLNFLVDNGHLEASLSLDGHTKFRITDKGDRLRYFLSIVQGELESLFPPIASPAPTPTLSLPEHLESNRLPWRRATVLTA